MMTRVSDLIACLDPTSWSWRAEDPSYRREFSMPERILHQRRRAATGLAARPVVEEREGTACFVQGGRGRFWRRRRRRIRRGFSLRVTAKATGRGGRRRGGGAGKGFRGRLRRAADEGRWCGMLPPVASPPSSRGWSRGRGEREV